MKNVCVFAAVVLSFAIAAPAQAFHPAEETYGYVPPKNLQRAHRGNVAPQPLFGMGWDWGQPQDRSDSSDDVPSKQRSPSSLTGGGQPHIAAVAPPKVSFPNSYGAGSIVIDTAGRRLYYVLSSSTAYRYPIAVGKQGFAWSGTEKISKKVAWPEWRPPVEMRARKPGLPEHMGGGIRNPLGAMRALSRQHALSHPRHQRRQVDRHGGVVRLHPHDQRQRDAPFEHRRRRHHGACSETVASRYAANRASGLADAAELSCCVQSASAREAFEKANGLAMCGPVESPSHMTFRPRTKVPTGQPVTSTPS